MSLGKITMYAVVGIGLLVGADMLFKGSILGKGGHGGNSGVSVGPISGSASTGPGVLHNAKPSIFPALPAYAPNEEPRPGLIAFAFDAPAYDKIDAIQAIGDGSTISMGSFRWKPVRAGEMRLFDQSSGVPTGRALALVMRGAFAVPFGGSQTLGLRLTHPDLKAGLRCSLHILVGGSSYASDYYAFAEKTKAGSVETTATFDGLAPMSVLDIGYAFACASEDGDQTVLEDIVIDPIEKTAAKPSWRLMRESDFMFPRSAI